MARRAVESLRTALAVIAASTAAATLPSRSTPGIYSDWPAPQLLLVQPGARAPWGASATRLRRPRDVRRRALPGLELAVHADLELTVPGEVLEPVLVAAAVAACLAALKRAIDGPPVFSPRVGTLRGRTMVITGGSQGLGLEAAVRLAQAGATIVCTVRGNSQVAQATLATLRAAAGEDADVHVLPLDLADLASIKAFAHKFSQQPYGSRIDVLLNNAGVMAVPDFRQTKDGFELQLGVNHLGHFALTGLLLPLLQSNTGHTRIINVSSSAHLFGDSNRLQASLGGGCLNSRDYSAWPVYCASKLANVVFTKELNRRFKAAGVRATAVSLHPGLCPTELARFVVSGEDKPMEDFYGKLAPPVQSLMRALKSSLRPIDRGANTHVYLAVGADGGYGCSGGEYFEDMKIARTNPIAGCSRLGGRLWSASEHLTGIAYDFAAAAEAKPVPAQAGTAGERGEH